MSEKCQWRFYEFSWWAGEKCYSSGGVRGIRWGTSWEEQQLHCAQCNCMKFAGGKLRFPTPLKNFQNMYCVWIGALFCHIFVVVFSEEPSLLMPKTSETPSPSFALAPRPALRRKRERTAGGRWTVTGDGYSSLQFSRVVLKQSHDPIPWIIAVRCNLYLFVFRADMESAPTTL